MEITVRDCGPRDGLQGERPLPVETRAWLANALAAAGVGDVEAVSFVSPKAVPAMAEPAAVVARLAPPPAARPVRWWALVPNRRGAELAVAAGMTRLTVTVSASPGYSAKNVGMTVEESVAQVGEIRTVASEATIDAVISCSFGSPFDDGVSPESVATVATQLLDQGVDQLTLADTTGTATPRRIGRVLAATGAAVGLHLHDTRGTALLNAHTAIGLGVRRFDTSVGGIGGSPFAPGAGGNLATEDLVLVLDDLGIDTGIDLVELLAVSRRLGEVLGRPLPSRVGQAGPLPPF